MIFRKKKKKKLIIWTIIILTILLCFFWLFIKDFSSKNKIIYGVTFSKKYAIDLELDWKEAYMAILNELNVSNIRLVAYWDEIEAVQDSFNFEDLDWQLDQAKISNVDVILALGRRAPRWPECHDPKWIKDLAPLVIKDQQLEFIRETIMRYRNNEAIKSWQVENEPLFAWFGECPKPSKEFLIEEINLVKSLSVDKPIIVTDSGELSHWQNAASVADILGITMYRVVWNEKYGFWDYFFVPPSIYRLKADFTKFFNKNLKEIIITELQMEPWTMNRRMVELSLDEQQMSFNFERFKNNLNYAKKAGFTETYLWGAEYWYWLKKTGYPEIWKQAIKIWQ